MTALTSPTDDLYHVLCERNRDRCLWADSFSCNAFKIIVTDLPMCQHVIIECRTWFQAEFSQGTGNKVSFSVSAGLAELNLRVPAADGW